MAKKIKFLGAKEPAIRGLPLLEGEPGELELGPEAPIVGGIVGGIFGGIPGAAGGGAAMEGLRTISETGELLPDDLPERAASEGLYMGMAEGAGRLIPPVAKLLKGEVTGNARMIGEWVKELGLPITPANYIKSRFSRGAQWMAELFPTGRLLAQHRRQQLKLALMVMRDEIVKGPKIDQTGAGSSLVEGLKMTSKKVFKQSQKKFQDLVTQAGGLTSDIEMPATSRVAREMLEEHGSDLGRLKGVLQKFLKNVKGADDKTTIQAFEELRKSAWSSTTKETRYLGGQIQEALLDDLGRWDDIMNLKLTKTVGEAKDLFKIHKALSKTSSASPTVRNIYRMADMEPRSVIRNAFQSGNFKDLYVIRNEMIKQGFGDEWKMAETRFFQNILDTATKVSDRGDLVFQPSKFLKTWENYRGQISLLAPDQFALWDRFAKIIEAASSDLIEAQTPMGLKDLAKLGGTLGVGEATAGTPGIVVPYGFSLLLSQSLSNPSGLMRAWLTNGGVFDQSLGRLTSDVIKAGGGDVGRNKTALPDWVNLP